jgi:hypothetical protein
VRVRTFGLRLIAAALTAAWTLTAGLVLLVYRPGGPFDLLVGVAAGLPIVVALAALVWPPVARGDRAFASLVWLGIGSLLLLLPSIGGVLTQLLARGPQTLLPSLEAAYPWFLALLGTSVFSGLGVARRTMGETALRRSRLVRGVAFGLVATLVVGSAFTSVAVANELALRDRPVAASRYGPTDPDLEPPACTVPPRVGEAARVDLLLTGTVDLRPIGNVDLRGVRNGDDFRWLAYVATNRGFGQHGAARIGPSGWRLAPGEGWRPVPVTDVAGADLDAQVLEVAIEAGSREAAEDHGLEFFEGARARHCRVAVDGRGFRAAFPAIVHLVGDVNLTRWRGELDYWVFADGEIGRVFASANGEAFAIVEGGLQAELRATMIATDRDRNHVVVRPTR